MTRSRPTSNRRNEPPMPDPVGFFITVTTCGTWLPGDARGWVRRGKGFQPPMPILERARRAGELVREKWWTAGGSCRRLDDLESLVAAIEYVRDGQDRPRYGLPPYGSPSSAAWPGGRAVASRVTAS